MQQQTEQHQHKPEQNQQKVDQQQRTVRYSDALQSSSQPSVPLLDFLPSDESERRKGYAKEALVLMIEYAFQQLHFNQLYCNIAADNNISINLFSALDFMLVGVKKKWNKTADGWQDELLFQRLCE